MSPLRIGPHLGWWMSLRWSTRSKYTSRWSSYIDIVRPARCAAGEFPPERVTYCPVLAIRRPKQNSTIAPATREVLEASRSSGRVAGGDHSRYSSTRPAGERLVLGRSHRCTGPAGSFSLSQLGRRLEVARHVGVSSSASRTTTLGRPCLVITTRRCSVSIPSTTSDRRACPPAIDSCSAINMTKSVDGKNNGIERRAQVLAR
jgi:hypothetical protein